MLAYGQTRIEPVIHTLPTGLDDLRAEARGEGHRFLDRLAADWECGETRFDAEGEALFAVFAGVCLAGVGGLTTEPSVHGAFRMRRFYVRNTFRRQGIGRLLVHTLLSENRRTACMITVNAPSPDAKAFWEGLGFLPCQEKYYTHILSRTLQSSLYL